MKAAQVGMTKIYFNNGLLWLYRQDLYRRRRCDSRAVGLDKRMWRSAAW